MDCIRQINNPKNKQSTSYFSLECDGVPKKSSSESLADCFMQ